MILTSESDEGCESDADGIVTETSLRVRNILGFAEGGGGEKVVVEKLACFDVEGKESTGVRDGKGKIKLVVETLATYLGDGGL